MRRILSILACALVGTSLTGPSLAVAADGDDEQLRDIIKAVEWGWENADGAPFREHFLDFEGARYIESGGQNEGLTDLIEHHVVPEGDAFDAFDLTLGNVETHIEGDFAWAIANVELRAVRKRDGSEIHVRGYETLLFRRVGGAWKVVHTHGSTRPVPGD